MAELGRTEYMQLCRLAKAPKIASEDELGMGTLLTLKLITRTRREQSSVTQRYEYAINDEGRQYLIDHAETPELVLSPTAVDLVQYILSSPKQVLDRAYDTDRPGNQRTVNRLVADGALVASAALPGAWIVSNEGKRAFEDTLQGARFVAEQKEKLFRAALDEEFAQVPLAESTDDVGRLLFQAGWVAERGAEQYAGELRVRAEEMQQRDYLIETFLKPLDVDAVEIKLFPNQTLCGIRLDFNVNIGLDAGIFCVDMQRIRVPSVWTPAGKNAQAQRLAKVIGAAATLADRLNEAEGRKHGDERDFQKSAG